MSEHYAVRVEQHAINRLSLEDEPGQPFHRLFDYDERMIGTYIPSEKTIMLSSGSQYLEPYAIKSVAAWFRLEPAEIIVGYD